MELRELQDRIDALRFSSSKEEKDLLINEIHTMTKSGDWEVRITQNPAEPSAAPCVMFINEKTQQFLEAPVYLEE